LVKLLVSRDDEMEDEYMIGCVEVLYLGYCRLPITAHKSRYDQFLQQQMIGNYAPRTGYGPTTHV
jgi:hypothetical protein